MPLLILIALVLNCVMFGQNSEQRSGRRWLISVGISTYPDRKALPNASRDAKEVEKFLREQHGFELLGRPLRDADRKSIEEVLTTSGLKNVDAKDTVVFFFAGHGVEAEGHAAIATADPGSAGRWRF
jgi:uncharacterized caspase-like protein